MNGPRVLLASALLAIGCLFSCQLVLGNFEVTDAPPESSIGGCKDGSLRCNDAWLFCESVKNGDFVTIEECASAEQCDSTLGDCAVCNANEVRCIGAKLEGCLEDRTGWALIRECPTADECNVNARTCKVCTPGEMPQCTGVEQRDLVECGPDLQWVSLGACASAELCQRSAIAIAADPATAARECIPPQCPTPGAYQCEVDGVTLSRCAPDLTGWTPVDTCASEALCDLTVADPDGATARGSLCVPPVCVPADTYRCTGPVLERCVPDLTGWDQIDTCVNPYQCNTNQRACTGPCTPGDLQCNGLALEYCTDAQVWAHSDDCINASLCQLAENEETGLHEGGCVEPTCLPPGAYQCADAVLQRCYPDQTYWEDIETCRSPALCNAIDARCDPIGCEPPGGLQCNPLNPSELRRCPDDLVNWESVIVCASTEACNTDVNGPSCVSQCPDPPVRCNGAVYERCSGVTGQPVWTGQVTCATPELCQCGFDGTCNGSPATDGLCHDPVCGANLGSSRCDGSRLEACEAGRNDWALVQDCGSASMCLPGTSDNGYCAVCSVGSEKQCNANVLRTCTSDRRTWASSMTCTIGVGCINNSTNDYCAVCSMGDVRCASGSIQPCGADSLWGATTPCAVACVGSGNSGYCADCSSTWAQCTTSDDLQACGMDRRWGTITDCALGCVEAGNTDYCAVCVPGQAQCVTGGRQVCGADERWGATMACSVACVNSGTADYCAECTAGDTECTTSGGVRTCGTNRLWGAATACSIACVNSGTADYCAECTAGDTECTTSGGVRTCGTNRLWGAATACSIACVNSGTADYCAECTAGDTECTTSGGVRTCGTNRLWGAATACSIACVNSGTADYCAECTAGDTECTTSGGVRTCGTNRLWGAATACSIACVNSGTADYCAECTAGDTECTTSGGVRTCGTNRLWGAATACSSFGCVNSGTADYCAECDTGDSQCVSGDVQACGSDRLWGAITACSLACHDSGSNDYCTECAMGDARCVSGGLETCNSSTLLWNAASPCTIACVGTGNDGYCAECTPGEVECQSDGLATCGDDSLWGSPASCPFGCLDETPDRCAECIIDTDCAVGTCSAGTCI